MYEIDLCAVCLSIVNDEKIPTKIYPHGTTIIFIDHFAARDLLRGLTKIIGVDGMIYPMVAITTVNGTRVCARHCKERPWE